MKTFIHALFSPSGRLNRVSFYLNSVVILGIVFIGALISDFLATLMGLLGGCLLIIQIIKRLHDLDRSGWHYFLFIIPLYNIYLAAVVLFVPGTVGVNNYGQDPLKKY